MPKPAASIEMLLSREVNALDRLVGEVAGGFRDQRHFDALEERARAISEGVLGAFRGKGLPK